MTAGAVVLCGLLTLAAIDGLNLRRNLPWANIESKICCAVHDGPVCVSASFSLSVEKSQSPHVAL